MLGSDAPAARLATSADRLVTTTGLATGTLVATATDRTPILASCAPASSVANAGCRGACLAVLLAISGFVAAVFFDAPIDLPPGDAYSLTISNDTRGPVEAFICDDETCTRGVMDETIQPRQNLASFNEDQYTPSPVGLADLRTHRLLGCLTPPSIDSFSRPPATTTVLVSSLHPCARQPERTHPVVTFYDPTPGYSEVAWLEVVEVTGT
jgi:hypothetical protein